jgi:hypothetical protein
MVLEQLKESAAFSSPLGAEEMCHSFHSTQFHPKEKSRVSLRKPNSEPFHGLPSFEMCLKSPRSIENDFWVERLKFRINSANKIHLL